MGLTVDNAGIAAAQQDAADAAQTAMDTGSTTDMLAAQQALAEYQEKAGIASAVIADEKTACMSIIQKM